jgi:hypothetical protein
MHESIIAHNRLRDLSRSEGFRGHTSPAVEPHFYYRHREKNDVRLSCGLPNDSYERAQTLQTTRTETLNSTYRMDVHNPNRAVVRQRLVAPACRG